MTARLSTSLELERRKLESLEQKSKVPKVMKYFSPTFFLEIVSLIMTFANYIWISFNICTVQFIVFLDKISNKVKDSHILVGVNGFLSYGTLDLLI